MNAALKIIMASALLALTNRCSSQVAGGSSTETTNSVVASAVNSSGDRIPGAHARLRPADYLVSQSSLGAFSPRTVRDLKTDQKGRIHLDSLPSGTYVLEFNNGVGEASMIRFEILGRGKHMDLGSSILAPFSGIKGTVVADAAAGKVRVEIFGLERQVLVDSANGRYSMPNIPAGNVKVRFFAESENYGSLDQTVPDLAPAQVVELDTIRLTASALEDYSQWQHFRDIQINTTPSGGDVAGDILGFPLLIRLDSTNFDFHQAQPGGQDIRFAKSDGTKIPYQIGYWDLDSGRASVWVLADTIRGNDSLQTLRMYWGKARASNFSNGAKVFRTEDGFAGVWHLDGTSQDATANHIRSEVEGTHSPLGLTGLAAGFAGIGHSIRFLNQAELNFGEGDFTASIWVKLDKLGGAQQLFCKREPYGGHFELQIQGDGKARFHLKRLDSASYLESVTPFSIGKWHQLCAARSKGMALLFLDGKQEASLNFPSNVSSGSDLILGQDIEEPESLRGTLDEFRLSGSFRSPDWIKLQYENQKLVSKVIRFR